MFAGLDTCLEVDHLASVTGLVAAGLGVSLLPSMTLFQFRHPDIVVVPLAGKSRLKRSLYLIRRSEKSLSSAARTFYELLQEQRGSLPEGQGLLPLKGHAHALLALTDPRSTYNVGPRNFDRILLRYPHRGPPPRRPPPIQTTQTT